MDVYTITNPTEKIDDPDPTDIDDALRDKMFEINYDYESETEDSGQILSSSLLTNFTNETVKSTQNLADYIDMTD